MRLADAYSPRTLVILAVVAGVAAAVLGLVVSVEQRRDQTAAQVLEAAHAAQDLAARITACSDRDRFDTSGSTPRTLPPTTKKVPAVLPRAARYTTSAADWDDPAFRCADFSILEPQAFQLQWVLSETPEKEWLTAGGWVRAELDLDGDGTADHVVETSVGCTKDMCMVAPNVNLRTVR